MRRILLIMLLAGLCCGCRSYYRVQDPGTGKSYYTTRVQRSSTGAVSLTDERTGNRVTLQNSEISKLTAQQYDNAVRGVE